MGGVIVSLCPVSGGIFVYGAVALAGLYASLAVLQCFIIAL